MQHSHASVPFRPAFPLLIVFVFAVGLVACSGQAADISTPVEPATPLPSPVTATAAIAPAEMTETLATQAPPEPSAATAAPVEGAGQTQDEKPLAARVNGQPVYLDAWESQVSRTEQALTDQGILLEGDEGAAQRAQIRQNVLQGLIEQALIEQAATAMQITVTDDELNKSLEDGTSEDGKSLETWLAENNLTMDELRRMQRSQLVTSKVIQELSEMVPTSAEQVHARHIFTTDQAKAEAAKARLTSGEDFATVANEVSEDLSTASNGGDLGWFPRQTPMMPPAVMDVVFALEPGQTSDVVHSEIGFHIVMLEAKEANRALTDDVLMYVRQLSFRQWLDQQTADANIERFVAQ